MSQSDRLFLEDCCPTLRQKLSSKLLEGKDVPEQDFQDFEVGYSVASDETTLRLSIRYPFLAEVLKYGSQDLLERVWEGLPLALSVDNCVLGVSVDVPALGEDVATRERCVQLLLNTRIWLIIGPLVERLRWLQEATSGGRRNTTMSANAAEVPPAVTLQVRQLETCWIVAKADRVLVIFTVHLEDEVDVALGRAFCQEIADPKMKDSSGGLPCSFFEPKEPPAELRSVALNSLPNVGFLSLSVSDQVVRGASEDRLHAIARPVMTFRNFFNFHLKNAKSYLHSRLRKRLDRWEQELNRSRRTSRRSQEKLLMSGKKFVPNASHPGMRTLE